MFLECREVGSSLGGVLAVDEGIVFLAILVSMGDHYLYVFTLQVDDRVEGFCRYIVVQEVEESMAR